MIRPRKSKTWDEKLTSWIGSVSSLIVHTILFIGVFVAILLGAPVDKSLLVLTTIVSLEAIYLSILIQMSVNRTTQSLEDVQQDIDSIQNEVEDIGEEIEDIQEDIEEIGENIEDIEEATQTK